MISSFTLVAMLAAVIARHSYSSNAQMMLAPMGVCFLQDSTLAMAQSFCRLASVSECNPDDEKNKEDASQFQCYMRCGTAHEQGQKLYNCTEYDMECFEGVTCILPPKRMKDEQDGYLRG